MKSKKQGASQPRAQKQRTQPAQAASPQPQPTVAPPPQAAPAVAVAVTGTGGPAQASSPVAPTTPNPPPTGGQPAGPTPAPPIIPTGGNPAPPPNTPPPVGGPGRRRSARPIALPQTGNTPTGGAAPAASPIPVPGYRAPGPGAAPGGNNRRNPQNLLSAFWNRVRSYWKWLLAGGLIIASLVVIILVLIGLMKSGRRTPMTPLTRIGEAATSVLGSDTLSQLGRLLDGGVQQIGGTNNTQVVNFGGAPIFIGGSYAGSPTFWSSGETNPLPTIRGWNPARPEQALPGYNPPPEFIEIPMSQTQFTLRPSQIGMFLGVDSLDGVQFEVESPRNCPTNWMRLVDIVPRGIKVKNTHNEPVTARAIRRQ